ncbi:MAG: hypothetical protein MI784_16435 [Cytophagales bacterium]|nr:hypothetical protein [Cytophagales bacterium]
MTKLRQIIMDANGKQQPDELAELFRQKMSRAESPSLSDSLWERIEEDLNRIDGKGKRKGGFWWFLGMEGYAGIAAASAAVLLSAAVGLQLYWRQFDNVPNAGNTEIRIGKNTLSEQLNNVPVPAEEIRLGNETALAAVAEEVFAEQEAEASLVSALADHEMPAENASAPGVLEKSGNQTRKIPLLSAEPLPGGRASIVEEVLYAPVPEVLPAASLGSNEGQWLVLADFSSGHEQGESKAVLSQARMFGNVSDSYSGSKRTVTELQSETEKTSAFGVKVGWIKSRIVYQTGMQYYEMRMFDELESFGALNQEKERVSHSMTAFSEEEVITVKRAVKVFNVPLRVGYRVWDKRLQVLPHFGANLHFAWDDELDAKHMASGNQILDYESDRIAGFSMATASAGIDLSYPLLKFFSLNVGTVYEKSLKELSSEKEFVNKYPDGFSLNFGVQFNF